MKFNPRTINKNISFTYKDDTRECRLLLCLLVLRLASEVAAVVEHLSADNEDAEGRVGDFYLGFGEFCEKIS